MLLPYVVNQKGLQRYKIFLIYANMYHLSIHEKMGAEPMLITFFLLFGKPLMMDCSGDFCPVENFFSKKCSGEKNIVYFSTKKARLMPRHAYRKIRLQIT
jgi:hypothetical protein